MRRALRAEGTKLRTLPVTRWLLPGVTAATAAGGVRAGQAPAAILAVLVAAGEYDSGLIGLTLAAVPRRLTVLAAQGLVLAAAVTVAATASLLLPHHATGPLLYPALIALLAVGVASIVRDAATGVGLVLAVLYLPPLLARAIADPAWQRFLDRAGPAPGGLPVTAAWAAIALAAGAFLLSARDL